MNRLETGLTPSSSLIYNALAELTRSYFGSDAPKYIAKLIEVHLKKPPELLTREDLVSIIDWVRGTVSFLEEDQEVIERYIVNLYKLGKLTTGQ